MLPKAIEPKGMNSRTVFIAALQLQAHERDAFDIVWPRILQHVVDAGRTGAQLIVLPEGTVPAYVIGKEPIDPSVSERALNDVQEAARATGAVIVYGSVRTERNLTYNSAYVVDADGTLAGTADKCFLWHFDRQWFAPGSLRGPIQTSLGKLGVLICADGRVPTIARRLVDDGAEILVMPTAWVTSGRDPQNLENAQADLLARVRAQENLRPFVAANKVGVERRCVAYCGKSQILDSGGNTVARASQDRPEILTGSVALSRTIPARARARHDLRRAGSSRSSRIALTPFDDSAGVVRDLLRADYTLGPGNEPSPDAQIAIVDDATMMDPAGAIVWRAAGYRLLLWKTELPDMQLVRSFARARALELRLFVAVVAEDRYAFAVDPDGTIVCGTFGEFRTTLFHFEPARTAQTSVAPDTDIEEALGRF